MRRLFLGGIGTLCLAAGAVSGVKAQDSTPVVRTFVAATSPGAVPAEVPADLPAPNLELEVEPSAVRKDGKGELLELEVQLRSNFGKDAVAQYSYAIVTDEGRTIQGAQISPMARLAPKAQVRERIATPAGLPDGFYQVRVSAVASDKDEDVAVGADRYFRVEGRVVTPMSASEWYAQSNANRARKI
jgi:hypothetical protein